MKRVRLSTMSVLDMSFRVIGVRAGFVWARVACVISSSLLLIVYTSSCICFATRIALCVCCFLSTSFVVVWRRYLKDGTEPSEALPGHVVVGRGCGAGFVRAVVGPCIVYVSRSGRLDLLAIDGVRAVVRCRGHRFGGALHDSVFFFKKKTVFFAMCVSITVSDSDRGG